MDAEAIREATGAAVAAALEELDAEEPLPAIERSAPAPAGGDEGEDDDEDQSSDDLDRIDADPKLKATYRSLVRRNREAHERLDAKLRDRDEALEAVRALQANPRMAAKALAKAVGGDILFDDEKPTPTLMDRARAKLAERVGKEAAEALAEPLAEMVEAATAPVRGRFEAQDAEATQQAMAAGIKEFAQKTLASGGAYDKEIEREMAKLVPKYIPGPGTTLPEYLSMLHAKVTSRRGVRGDDEPGRTRRTTRDDEPSGGGTIRAGMDPRKAIEIAVHEAERDFARMRGRRR